MSLGALGSYCDARVCVYVSAFVGFIDVVLQAMVNLIVGYLWVYVSVVLA